MPTSAARLIALATETGFRTETLEKVVRLGELALEMSRHPLLARALVLKGGTALNLAFGPPARLSVDLDFNYIGALDREAMRAERPIVEDLIARIASSEGYRVQWSPPAHAGRVAHLSYVSALGGPDALKVDLNFLFRLPLGETTPGELWMPGDLVRPRVPLAPLAEIVAGKLIAALDRVLPRDLFDVARLPSQASNLLSNLDFRRLFVGLAGVLPRSLTTYGRDRFRVTDDAVREQLLPMLAPGHTTTADELGDGAWEVLEPLLTLDDAEREFSDRLQTGDFRPELLFPNDVEMRPRIAQHPALLWKVQNAQEYSRARRKNRREDA